MMFNSIKKLQEFNVNIFLKNASNNKNFIYYFQKYSVVSFYKEINKIRQVVAKKVTSKVSLCFERGV